MFRYFVWNFSERNDEETTKPQWILRVRFDTENPSIPKNLSLDINRELSSLGRCKLVTNIKTEI